MLNFHMLTAYFIGCGLTCFILYKKREFATGVLTHSDRSYVLQRIVDFILSATLSPFWPIFVFVAFTKFVSDWFPF
jgi:hypothetical protein